MTGSDEEERESAEDQREDSLDLNAINFLSRSIRTRFGRVISLSHRALDTFMPVDFGRRFQDFLSTFTKPGHYSL